MVGVDEFLSLRREVLAELNRSDTETPDEAPPGVEAAPGDEQVGTNVVSHTVSIVEKTVLDVMCSLITIKQVVRGGNPNFSLT